MRLLAISGPDYNDCERTYRLLNGVNRIRPIRSVVVAGLSPMDAIASGWASAHKIAVALFVINPEREWTDERDRLLGAVDGVILVETELLRMQAKLRGKHLFYIGKRHGITVPQVG